MNAIDAWLTELQQNHISDFAQPIRGKNKTCQDAWTFVNSSIGGGVVSSVGLQMEGVIFNAAVTGSPVTSAGTLQPSLKSIPANQVYAGPTSGAAAPGTIRALVAGDVPDLSATYLPLAGGTMTGQIKVPNGSAGAPSIAWNTNWGFVYDVTNTALDVIANGAVTGGFKSTGYTQSIPGGGASTLINQGEGSTNNRAERYTNDATEPSTTNRKARGTIAAPLVAATNDFISGFLAQAYNGTGFTSVSDIRTQLIEPTPSATAMGAQILFQMTALGAVALTEVLRLNVANGLQMFGGNTVIDAQRLVVKRGFTVATLPTGVLPNSEAFVTNSTLGIGAGLGLAPVGGGTNIVPVYTIDGTNWTIG